MVLTPFKANEQIRNVAAVVVRANIIVFCVRYHCMALMRTTMTPLDLSHQMFDQKTKKYKHAVRHKTLTSPSNNNNNINDNDNKKPTTPKPLATAKTAPLWHRATHTHTHERERKKNTQSTAIIIIIVIIISVRKNICKHSRIFTFFFFDWFYCCLCQGRRTTKYSYR